jgi:hypothetical protein
VIELATLTIKDLPAVGDVALRTFFIEKFFAKGFRMGTCVADLARFVVQSIPVINTWAMCADR